MRVAVTVLALLLPALAGCLNAEMDLPGPRDVSVTDLEVPAGATVEALPDGVRLSFLDVALPFKHDFVIPKGATMARATIRLGDDVAPRIQFTHADTGRRRCQLTYYDAWYETTKNEMTCTGLTVHDAPGDAWTLKASAPLDAAKLLTVDFTSTPLDGLVGALDLTDISRPTLAVDEPFSTFLESFDGTDLYAEITVPQGDGPWPVVIASSPYTTPAHKAGEPAMWDYFVHDWAKRGYAIVVADVRGFGDSGGCVDVWGEDEQRDQKALVEWAATQAWSNGNIGFYGQSYVGTTPLEAAVQTPPALKAIISVAPVVDAYRDWHFGGVPNGENTGSPGGYQTIGRDARIDGNDPVRGVENTANGYCDPDLLARSQVNPAEYDAFYDERNFTKRAGAIDAAVLYTQGFFDYNVKSEMIRGFFNEITAPKLGLFGHWIHQHPNRADQDVLFVAWMDQYVKGKAIGFENLPNVEVRRNDGTVRAADAWPPVAPEWRRLGLAFDDGALVDGEGSGNPRIAMSSEALPVDVLPQSLELTHTVTDPFALAGDAALRLRLHIEPADNAYLAAFLFDGDTRVTWGMFNVAHRNGHDRHDPVQPGDVVDIDLPFLPTEHVFEAGDELRLVVRAARAGDWFAVDPTRPGAVVLHGDASYLALGLAPSARVAATPVTADR